MAGFTGAALGEHLGAKECAHGERSECQKCDRLPQPLVAEPAGLQMLR